MLPKKNRLPLRSKINFLKQNGRMIQNPLFGFLYYLDDKQLDAQFVCVISNKTASKATERNKTRRLLSENIRLILNQVNPKLQAVFLIKKAIIGCDFATIKQELNKIFIQYHLYLKNEKGTTTTG